MKTEQLIDLDFEFYRLTNQDLLSFSHLELQEHYFKHGYFEGRMNSAASIRENFVKLFNEGSILEIGPFNNPLLSGSNVEYFDVLTTAQLKERAKDIGFPFDGVPNINYVAKDGSLGFIEKRFDVVISSHNIEHQPDLIAHLNEVSSKLNENGVYALIVPNARYCFDANLPLSKISEIINAHFDKRKMHTIGSVVEHLALTTHNDSERHWRERGNYQYEPIDSERVARALKRFNDADGKYIDVHAWQFDPLSFSDILSCLISINYIDFSHVVCNGPVYGRNEFTLIIHK